MAEDGFKKSFFNFICRYKVFASLKLPPENDLDELFNELEEGEANQRWEKIIRLIINPDSSHFKQPLAKLLATYPFNKWDAFYTVIRLGSIKLLKKLIRLKGLDKPEKNIELTSILAKNMENLKLRNVKINKNLSSYIEKRLILLRFIENFYIYKVKITYKERKDFITKIIDQLCIDYDNSDEVDDSFLFKLRFIANNMLILAAEKKDNKDCWAEKEFLLNIFIASVRKQNVDFKVPFDKNDVLGLLKDSDDEMKNNHKLIRSMYALNRIQKYIKLIKESKIENNNTTARLLIERCFQVTGEYLNNKNIPDHIENNFNKRHPGSDFFKILRNVRHSLTHNKTYSVISNVDLNALQKDLLLFFPHIFNFLFMEQFELFKLVGRNTDLLNHTVNSQLKQVDNFISYDLVNSIMKCCNDNNLILRHFMRYKSSEVVMEKFVGIIKNIYSIDILKNLCLKNTIDIQNIIYDLFKALTEDEINLENVKRNIPFSKSTKNKKNKINPDIDYFKGQIEKFAIKCVEDIESDDSKFSACEMLSLDFLEYFLSESQLNIRVRFMDDYYPIAFGSQLRNHIAHINPAFENLPNTSAIHFVLKNAKLFKRKNEHDASLNLDELTARYDTSKEIVTLQNDLFRASSEGDIDKFKECISKGADIAGVNFEGCSTIELAAQTDANKVFFYLLHNELMEFQTSRLFEIAIKNNNINNLKLLWEMGKKIQPEEKFNGLSCVHLAVINKREEITQLLLSYGAGIESKGINDLTPLHLAVLINSSNIVILLLQQGANVKARDVNGNTVIHIAAIFGYVELFPILKSKIRFDLKNNLGRTPLHIAVANGHQQFVNLLIENVDIESADEDGKTAIHYAAENGHRDIFNLLLEHKANPAAKSKNGDNVLHLAACNGHEQIVEEVFERGIIEGNSKNSEGNTALHLAAQQNHTSIVEYLVRKGVNKYLFNNYICMAFELSELDAIRDILHEEDYDADEQPSFLKKLNNEYAPLFELLKDSNSTTRKTFLKIIASMQTKVIEEEIEDFVNISDEDRKCMLHRAAFHGCTEMVKSLLKKNVTVDSVINGVTALHLAALKGQTDIFKMLLENVNEDTHQKNKNLLIFATINCKLDIMRILLKKGVNVHFKVHNDLTALDFAAYNDHSEAIKLLLDNNVNIDIENTATLRTVSRFKHLTLHCAALGDTNSCINILLKKGAKVDAKCFKKSTALHLAAYSGNQSLVRTLLSQQANIEAQDEDTYTPLHLAAAKGHEQCVQFLLEREANVGAETEHKLTPLHLAANFGNQQCIEILLDKNANIEAEDENKYTPLHLAAAKGHEQCVQFLLEREANVDAETAHELTALHLAADFGYQQCMEKLLDKDAKIEAKDVHLRTSLHLAAKKGHELCVQILLEKGANVKAKAEDKSTPLHFAAISGNQECMNKLLDNHANIEARDKNLRTPLHLAAKEGHGLVTQLLLGKGANFKAQDKDKSTPLHYAAMEGHKACVQYLLEKDVDVEAEDANNSTPLHLAASSGNQQCMKKLLDKKAKIEVEDVKLRTPLHLAAEKGHKPCVQFLLEKHANIEAEDSNKSTPLHLAASSGNQQCVEKLLDEHANFEARDKDLLTPLHLAAREGHTACMEILLERGANID